MAEPVVAVLGSGRMGSAMAERLAGRGVQVIVYNRSAEPANALADRFGARVASSPADAAAQADVVISMVADDAAVRALYAGPDGVPAGIRAGTVAVDMSTVLPETVRAIAPAVLERGAGVLDAPVSGSVSSRWPVSGSFQTTPATTPATIRQAAPRKVTSRPRPSATTPQTSAPTVIDPVKMTI